MFCTKCGKEISDDSQFCIHCGAKQTPMVSVPIDRKIQKSRSNTKIINKKIIAVIAVIVLTLVVIRPIVTGRSVEKTVDVLFDAINDGDGEKMLSVMPDEQVDYVVNTAGVTKEEYINKINESLNELKTGKGLGSLIGSSSISINSISLSYDIVSKTDCSEEELKQLNEKLKEKNIQDVKKVKKVKISISAKINSAEVKSAMTSELQMIKIKNKWYITDLDGMDSVL